MIPHPDGFGNVVAWGHNLCVLKWEVYYHPRRTDDGLVDSFFVFWLENNLERKIQLKLTNECWKTF